MSLGSSGVLPATSLATAAAQTLAWALAEKADFGIAPAIEASPMTWMLGCNLDSKVAGSIGHQPVRSATAAISAIWPAFCGGMTFATSALCLSKSVTSVIAPTSTEVTLPPFDNETHSRLEYSAFHAFSNRRCLEKASLASRMISFDFGFLVLR